MKHHNLEIIDFYNFPNCDFRALIKSANGKHVYASQVSNNGSWCACVGFRVYKKCRHLKQLLQYISKHGDDIPMEDYVRETSIKGLNSLIGGIPIGLPVSFWGLPRTGKSTIAIWALMDLMNATNKNGLIIDAEKGVASHVLPDLISRFNDLNGTDIGVEHLTIDFRSWLRQKSSIVPYKTISRKEGKLIIKVIEIGNLQEMLLLVGKPHTYEVDTKKPKLLPYSFNLFPNSWDTPISQLMDDDNSEEEYCGLVFDSITVLMKEFGVEGQAFPVRDTAQSIILNQITQVLSNLQNVSGIIILHSSNPIHSTTQRPIPVGGKAMGHGFKYSLQFSLARSEGDTDTSIIVVPYRLPTSLGKATGELITINNKGVF